MNYGWTEMMYKRQMCIERQRERAETKGYEIWMDREDVQETDVHPETQRQR